MVTNRPKIAIGILLTRELLPAGGSFGTVYKAIEKSTGEIVAIKHVRSHESMICFSFSIDRLEWDTRSTSNRAKMIFRKYSRKSPSWPHAQVPT